MWVGEAISPLWMPIKLLRWHDAYTDEVRIIAILFVALVPGALAQQELPLKSCRGEGEWSIGWAERKPKNPFRNENQKTLFAIG